MSRYRFGERRCKMWEATLTWVKALPNGENKIVKDKLYDDDFMSLCQLIEDYDLPQVLEIHIHQTKKRGAKCLQGVR